MTTQTTKERAPKGGAFGANGEWYEGGKFINTVAENEKRSAKAAKKSARKQEIEAYVWAVPPVAGQMSLYRRFAGVFGNVRNGLAYVDCKQVTLDYYRTTLEEVQGWVDAYNRGQRWI